ncbi:type IV secretion system protein VirB10 [Bartonella phoceensis]|uniref:type IV secretion system protein VirB10 n=1 Tax=Bartonella phoceensis TaxID=270249 RepID=UPI001ABA1988|nr:type IV secretion system protein VirB10 [Bartonella phoceensis]
MFDDKKGDGINKGVTPNYTEQEHIEGAYGSSELGSERRPVIPGVRILLMVGFIIIIIIPVALTWKALKMRNAVEMEEERPQQVVQQIIPQYTPRIIEEPKVVEEIEKPAQTEDPAEELPAAWAKLLQTTVPPHLIKDSEELARKRMLNSSLNSGGSEGSVEHLKNDTSDNSKNNSALFNNLQPVRLGQSRAVQLRNRDFLITQGTQMDCTLETKIITSQPGMTTCHLTRDIYSASGRVILLDRGSKVIGFYQSGIQQGQTRVFVQWSRIETPSGVIVNIDSPGTGPLGEAGIGGWVDTHFWQRFGGAAMLSIIGDLGGWVRDKVGLGSKKDKEKSQTRDFAGAESVVTGALQNSINIQPTLYKNQGERVNIFVARDLDFSDVYSLVTR